MHNWKKIKNSHDVFDSISANKIRLQNCFLHFYYNKKKQINYDLTTTFFNCMPTFTIMWHEYAKNFTKFFFTILTSPWDYKVKDEKLIFFPVMSHILSSFFFLNSINRPMAKLCSMPSDNNRIIDYDRAKSFEWGRCTIIKCF